MAPPIGKHSKGIETWRTAIAQKCALTPNLKHGEELLPKNVL
jgi:hypothetical protein